MDSASNRSAETAVDSYPTIAATATALPPHTITRDDVKYYMGGCSTSPSESSKQ